MRTGAQVKNLLVQHEKEALLAGFEDYMQNKLELKDIDVLMETHGVKLNEIISGRSKAVGTDAMRKGAEFLEEYLAKNPGAVKTSSGMVYHETATGTGPSPTDLNTVTTHYHGTFIDGTVFDSSVERGEPISFELKKVIKGWQEGITMMKAGGKATLIVPSSLGYGDEGSPPIIGPGSTLIFEVELLDVKQE
jgi:FKBP-type peptidyl-prolyl cis-trans isomerase